MKIYILYKLKSGPFGGVNQFFTALSEEFKKNNLLTDEIETSDIILFNSHLLGAGQGEIFPELIEAKLRYPEKIFIHRLDGPIDKYRNEDSGIDKKIYFYNNLISDGTIFQSNWSKEENYKMGFIKNPYEKTIINAPDRNIFNKNDKKSFAENGKIKLISTSWSKNLNKGFKLYEYLDENLDTTKYEMTYIGNTPIGFKNIKLLAPLESAALALNLKAHDIFITASRHDPCSNALIEAMHCGLPAIALNSGGHPEIVKDGGELFTGESDIIEKIEKVSANYKEYQGKISLPEIDLVAENYLDFMRKIFIACQDGRYSPKKANRVFLYKMLFTDTVRKIKRRLWS